jgi:hypothetical protein
MIKYSKIVLKLFLCLLPSLGHGQAINWPTDQALPHYPTACFPLDVVDMDKLNFHHTAFLSSLQGAFNIPTALNCKHGAGTLYLTRTTTEGKYNWLQTADLPFHEKTFDQILALYAPRIKCALVYDPDFPLSINLATHLGARRGCVIVDPVLAQILKTENPKIDINGALVGKYKSKNAFNLRILEEIKKQEKNPPRVLLSTTPVIADGIRELAYAFNEDMFIFFMTLLKDDSQLAHKWKHKPSWVKIKPEKKPMSSLEWDKSEEKQAAEFVKSLAPNTLAMGFYEGEVRSIIDMSNHKIPTIVGTSYNNYSLWSSLREPLLKQKPADPPKEVEKKLYLNLVIGDGDNMSYVQHFLKNVFDTWKGRGKYPLNWTIAPALLDSGPVIFNYFIKAATSNDYFVAGPSGLGYFHPGKWLKGPPGSTERERDQKEAEVFWKMNGKYLDAAGLKVINVVNERTKIDDEVGATIRKFSPDLIGIVNDAVKMKNISRSYLLNNDLPVSSLEDRVTNADELRAVLEARFKELEAGSEPIFVSLTVEAWAKDQDYVNTVLDESISAGRTVVALRSDQFFPLLKDQLKQKAAKDESKYNLK